MDMGGALPANEVGFRVGISGHSGHLRLEPLPLPALQSDPLASLPDFILPPAYPPETPESVKEYLEQTYLRPELDATEFSAEKSGRTWDFDWFGRANPPLEPSAPRTVLAPKWELPFRRSRNKNTSSSSSSSEMWVPDSIEAKPGHLLFFLGNINKRFGSR